MGLEACQFEDYMPRLLSRKELKDPEFVFTSFFESFDLKDAREYLQHSLTLMIEKNITQQSYRHEEENIRFFFEKVEKMMEAAWMMKN